VDDTTKLLAINLPLVAALAIWINSWIKVLYTDFKAQLAKNEANQEKMMDSLFDLKERVARIEESVLGDRSPTNKRPDNPITS